MKFDMLVVTLEDLFVFLVSPCGVYLFISDKSITYCTPNSKEVIVIM